MRKSESISSGPRMGDIQTLMSQVA